MSVLQEMKDICGSILVNGEFRKSKATESVAVTDPATEEVIGEIPETPAAEIDEIVDAAHAAQKTWWAMSALERAETMHDIANDLHAIKPKLAEALTREMGKPYKESADEVDWSATWELVRALVDTGEVQAIFLEIPLQRRLFQAAMWEGMRPEQLRPYLQWPATGGHGVAVVRHEKGHDGHIHVRVRCGPQEPRCRKR